LRVTCFQVPSEQLFDSSKNICLVKIIRSFSSVPSKSLLSSGHRRSSKANTPRPSTPSNPTNSSKSIRILLIPIESLYSLEFGQQFSAYDIDDGRSSRACQDVNDEECFNQLHEELSSECLYRVVFFLLFSYIILIQWV